MNPMLPLGLASTPTGRRLTSPKPMFEGAPALFIQMRADGQAFTHAAPLLAGEGMGAVITLSADDKLTAPQAAAARFLRLNPSLDHVLFDADRYSGQERAGAGHQLSHAWVRAQLDAGVRRAMTDSPYIAAGDLATLTGILRWASTYGDQVIAALPIHLSWLTDPTQLAELVREVNTYGVAVAVIGEHAKDPFGTRAAVQGLVDLIEQTTTLVLLLRSDLAAVGALAFGASAGAIGTSTTLRHNFIFTEKKDEKDFFPAVKPAAFAPCAMSYRTLEKIAAAVRADTQHPERWTCECDTCNGAPLSVITDASMAYQHSLSTIGDLAHAVLTGPERDRRATWVQKCWHAQIVNEELRVDLGIPWDNPPFLAAWHSLRQNRPGS